MRWTRCFRRAVAVAQSFRDRSSALNARLNCAQSKNRVARVAAERLIRWHGAPRFAITAASIRPRLSGRAPAGLFKSQRAMRFTDSNIIAASLWRHDLRI